MLRIIILRIFAHAEECTCLNLEFKNTLSTILRDQSLEKNYFLKGNQNMVKLGTQLKLCNQKSFMLH